MSNLSFRQVLFLKLAEKNNLTEFVKKKLKLDQEKPKFKALTNLGPGVSVYMSESAVKSDGAVDIIVNFRGVSGDPNLVAKNFSYPNAVVVTAEASGPRDQNKGSKLLEQQFGSADKINKIVSSVLAHLQKQFPDKKIHRGKLIVSGFSGGGSVVARAVAERNKIQGGIDGVVINDGLHAKTDTPTMQAIVDFAREAEKDPSKKFRIIHTAIKPSYTSTTETSNYILQQLGLQRQKVENEEPYKQYGFKPVSETQKGGLQITQMYDNPKLPYYVDNRAGSLGDTHVQSLWKGNPYIFKGILD